ncbi:MAG: baeS 3 [Marmoricola sp.]|nr:baeS 3 [Marmoricola sp.]
MARPAGLSVRLKLTLSYAAFLMLAGGLLLAAVWLFLLRYVPDRALLVSGGRTPGPVFPVRSNLLRVFAPRAAGVLAFLLVFGLVGGWILAGRMLAPLGRITDATRTAAAGALSHRIRLPGRRDEFRELADAFDAMMARLEAHVEEQRRFAANASHELRTPLAITQSLLDVARLDPAHDSVELVQRLRTVNTRAIDLTEALLLLSRADHRSFPRIPVDLSLVAEEAVETLLPLADKHGVTLETHAEATSTTGSPPLLLQLCTNLLHNAIVHNLAEKGTVVIRTSTAAGTAILTVENTGEHLTAEAASKLVEPFLRGAGRTRTNQDGVGLGLAIATRLTVAHDGTLTLTPRAAGGLRVEVRLPHATAGAQHPARRASTRPEPRHVDSDADVAMLPAGGDGVLGAQP